MPKNLLVEDTKPKMGLVEDTKPKMDLISRDSITQSYQVVLGAGMPMGLLLAITYPVAGTVTQWSEKG